MDVADPADGRRLPSGSRQTPEVEGVPPEPVSQLRFAVVTGGVYQYPASPHRPAVEALGLGEPASTRLCRYLDTLARWSLRVNLTAARSPAERVRLLVKDVLGAVSLPEPGRLIDVGSGSGSPGLVFALLRDDLEVTLLEPRVRRWAFLREAARGARSVSVVRARHDGYDGPAAATVSLRAIALPLRELAPLVAPGGRILVLGGRPLVEPPFVLLRELEAAVPGGARLFARA
jgi:16S rRNA (guanine527-N7)-methyltransferase